MTAALIASAIATVVAWGFWRRWLGAYGSNSAVDGAFSRGVILADLEWLELLSARGRSMDWNWLASVPWYGWVSLLALAALILWQYDRVAALLGRPLPDCHRVPDDVMWRAGEVFAAGLSVPVIIIDYDRRVRVYNRGAEDLTGHAFYSVHNHPFGLLLPDADEDSFRGWLDRYLKEFREGDAVQMVGHPRPMRIERKDGMVREVMATLTHFGNGHGGIQIELLPVG